MRGTVLENVFDAVYRVPAKRTFFQRFKETLAKRSTLGNCHCSIRYLFNCGDITRRDVATHHHALKFYILAGLRTPFERSNESDDSGELSSATSLFLVSIMELAGVGDSFSEGNLRFPGDTGDTVFSLHALRINLQVKLPHPRNDGLRGMSRVGRRYK
jgi:hypothetical protein